MATISLTPLNIDTTLIYRTLLETPDPVGPLTLKAIQKALSHLASEIPLPKPSALTEAQIAKFSEAFGCMKEQCTESVFLSTVSNVIGKIPKLFIFKGKAAAILAKVPVTISLSENTANAQSLKSVLISDSPLEKPFSDLSSLLKNPEFEDFQDIGSKMTQNKITELERIVSTYIGLINDRFDSIPLNNIEHLDYLIESLKELRIPHLEEPPIELEPILYLLINPDSYARSEQDQQAFKDLVIHRINKKIEEFQTMSPEQKENYIQERLAEKMKNAQLIQRLKNTTLPS